MTLTALPTTQDEDWRYADPRALAALGDVPRELGQEVISEFYSLAMAQGYVREGGYEGDDAITLIRGSAEKSSICPFSG